MELPELHTGPVQDEESQGYARVGAAAARLGGVVEQGVTALHQEIVKSQTNDATLALADSMGKLKTDLQQKKAFSPDELKAAVGEEAYNQIPDAIRNRPLEPMLDESGNQVVDPQTGTPQVHAGAIPAWQVAHLVFDKKAQELLDQASTHITAGEGWQNRFRQAALADVIRHKTEMSAHWAEQASQNLADDRQRQIAAAARAGNFDMAHALVDGSMEVLGKEGQDRARVQVGAEQQGRPVSDALLQFRTDPDRPDTTEKLKSAQAALADDSKTGLLTPEHRNMLARAVGAALKTADEGHQKRAAAGIALSLIQSSPDPMNPDKVDAAGAARKLDEAFKPGGKYADKPELYFEAQSLLSKTATDKNAAAKQQFDNVAGIATRQYNSIDENGVYHPSSQNLEPQVRAALHATGKDGEDLLNQFRLWDQGVESHNRTARNTPNDAEEARAFRIERSMAVNPGAWRAMSGADQQRILAGLLPVPGEPDAPAVAVSAKDQPPLSAKIAAISATVPPKYVTQPEKIALEEAEKAYPALKNPKNSNATARTALKGLTDQLATFIDTERNRTGKEPPQADVRKETVRLLQTVEVRRTFWFNRHIPRIQAEQEKVPYTEQEQPGQTEKPAAPAPRKPGDTVKGGDIGHPGHTFRVRTDGKLEVVQ